MLISLKTGEMLANFLLSPAPMSPQEHWTHSHICAIPPRFIRILGIWTQAIMVVRQAPYLSSHLSYLGILFLSVYEYPIKRLRRECMGHIKKCIWSFIWRWEKKRKNLNSHLYHTVVHFLSPVVSFPRHRSIHIFSDHISGLDFQCEPSK